MSELRSTEHEAPLPVAAPPAAVRRAAQWLAAQGVRAGDAVALCAPDSTEAAVARCAARSIRAVVVTLSPLASRRDMFAQLCGSGARWLITTSELFAQKLEVAARPSAVTATFLLRSAAVPGSPARPGSPAGPGSPALLGSPVPLSLAG